MTLDDARLDHLHVLCYRWGTRYGVAYANTLRAMVARHLSVSHTFHCMTDDPTGLDPRIEAHLLPDDQPGGNWNKLMTFQRDFLGLAGEHVVCLDLDLVIVDSIDFLAGQTTEDFLIGRNWAPRIRGNSSVYRVKVGAKADVWERFVADPEAVISRFHGKTRLGGDQRWMNHAIETYRFFPDGRIVSFKRHCRAKALACRLPGGLTLSTARFGVAVPPPGAAIVAFHGSPLPPDVATGTHGRWRRAPFVQEHWRP